MPNESTRNEVCVLVGGDLCPAGGHEALFAEGEAERVFGDALPWFQSSDISIVNLECPLIEGPSPAEKTGPTLGAPAACINGIKETGISALGLANNHIMDHGTRGLASTLETCKANGIATVGAGVNIHEAGRILLCQNAGMSIGIVAMAEHEFGIADEHTPGANPLDLIRYVRLVRQQRASLDYLIVLLHAGNEHHAYPRPSLRDACRFLAEEGANAVICQHSHCPGSYETYRDAHIVYGQGNLVFQPVGRSPLSWYTGFLVVLRIVSDGTSTMELIPYEQSISGAGVRILQGGQRERFLAELAIRSDCVLDAKRLTEEWARFCKDSADVYLSQLCANTPLVRKVMGRSRLLRRLCSSQSLLLKLNLLRSESHRDAMIQILTQTVEERGRR